MTNAEFETLTAGNIVMCNKEGRYNKTVPGIRCKILWARAGYRNDIYVEIIDGYNAGDRYYVSSQFFDVVTKLKQIEETEVLSLLV